MVLMDTGTLTTIPVKAAQIVCRIIGEGRPLLVLNGFGATSADWDSSFLDRLGSCNRLVLVNNRGIGGSIDDGQPFDVEALADDAAHVIETLGFERASILGWSMGGFIAQALAVKRPDRVDKLILLSTDSGTDADLAAPGVWSRLIEPSGTPDEQARQLLSLLFPSDVADVFYRDFGEVVAAARAQLSPDLLRRQAAAMHAWHRYGVAGCPAEIRVPVLIGAGAQDVVIPPSNARQLANAIPGAWLAQFPRGGHAFMAQYPLILADLINSFLAL